MGEHTTDTPPRIAVASGSEWLLDVLAEALVTYRDHMDTLYTQTGRRDALRTVCIIDAALTQITQERAHHGHQDRAA